MLLGLVATLVGAAATAFAAKRLAATSENLRQPFTMIAVATVKEQVAPNRFRFTKVRMIHGDEPEGPWDIRMSERTAENVKIDNTYTIAFSGHIERVPRMKMAPEIDPEGLRLVSDPIVGGEVLLPVAEELTFLLSADPEDYANKPQKVISAVVAVLGRGNGGLCRVAAGELALRKELMAQTDRRTRAVLHYFITRVDKDAQARKLLLEAGYTLPQGPESAWALAAARQIVKNARLAVEPDSYEPGLQRSAAIMLKERGDRDDTEALARLLASHSTGVAMAALSALDQIHQPTAIREVRKVLAKGGLPVQSRNDFELYLRRMQLHPIARPQPLQTPAPAPTPATSGGA
jgi:hypothetical protein